MRDELLDKGREYAEAVERSAWDGEWYRRAYFDDGSPLGSRTSDECKIDSIAQSWSVISRRGRARAHTRIAMQSLNKHLVREDARLIMLLTPPFDKTTHDPGYIQGYLPGVRENGAQYTHAALWAVLATALQGDGDRAFELYQMINPITHADTPEAVDIYKVEPYVVAADVYTAKGHLGRGGWTWYTGSASWMYRVGLEAILGFQQARRAAGDRSVHSGELEGIHDRVPGTDQRRTRSRSRIRTALQRGVGGADGRRQIGSMKADSARRRRQASTEYVFCDARASVFDARPTAKARL